MRPEATMTAYILDIDNHGQIDRVVVMVEKSDRATDLKKLDALTAGAEWSGPFVGFDEVDGYKA